MEKKMTIKDLPLEERPREKMKEQGAGRLSNTELLAIILRTGYREETAIHLAEKVISRAGGLRFLPDYTLEELQKIKGIGLAKAVQIKAALELGRRIAASFRPKTLSLSSPQEVAGFLMEEMRYYRKEYFKIILLDTKNQIISLEDISVGSLNSSIVHPREIFNVPIKKSAAAIILVHNHPSGDPHPSREDLDVTTRLVDAGKILGISVLDHIIVGEKSYFSFKEKGLLD
ncbi:MAG: DNA repair protein RadC [Firmicutes bacterium]|nr:DNA repair protein RadC [Bacillota bacterium]